ncbi:MAG: hypothetical protein H6813_03775 [Phycisphaeraceae bacterium]|nr:hypothetical protein [Phycisphaeraceae bacterium]MCB9847066.1 hypothetical protein [Phycisphaeraceae bacterium]
MILTSIVAASALNAAVVGQTGENYCHLTWDKQCCPVPGCDVGIAPGILTICNEKPDAAEFMWQLVDVSGMGLQFMPASGIAAPGNTPTGVVEPCIDIPFTVICPPNFPLGGVADYQAIVTKISTGETFTCFGNVRNVSDWKIDTTGDPVIDVPMPRPGDVATPVRANLTVSNIGSSGKDGVTIFAVPMGGFDVMPSQLFIPPTPPGTQFAVDSFFDICYGQNSRGVIPGQSMMGDVLLEIDTTGDGLPDTVIGSLTVRALPPSSAPCPGDLNGDGVVDTADLGILLGAFGTLCP